MPELRADSCGVRSFGYLTRRSMYVVPPPNRPKSLGFCCSSIWMYPRTARSTSVAVTSRMSTELSTSVPASAGVMPFGGSYCTAIGRTRGSRPRRHQLEREPEYDDRNEQRPV